MEELKAMFRVCAHIKKDKKRCNSPAMKGMNFCYQHIGGNIRELTRARSIYSGPKLDLLYPGFRQAIQHNLHVVAQAINDGHIDLQTANTYNRIYSACERNLRRFETLYQNNSPDSELAPIPDETDFPYTAPTQSEGGPLKPAVGLSGEQKQPFHAGAPQPALSSSKGLDETWEEVSNRPDAAPTESPVHE